MYNRMDLKGKEVVIKLESKKVYIHRQKKSK
jgi:hypothetical protein